MCIFPLSITHRLCSWFWSATYLSNCHIKPRRIFLCRHGETPDNVEGRIGGDCLLTNKGKAFGVALDHFLQQVLTAEEKAKLVWVCSRPLAKCSRIYSPVFHSIRSLHLEPILFCLLLISFSFRLPVGLDFNSTSHKGNCIVLGWCLASFSNPFTQWIICWVPRWVGWLVLVDCATSSSSLLVVLEGFTYKEISNFFPNEFIERMKDKLRYRLLFLISELSQWTSIPKTLRYPHGGESYVDLCNRLHPIILEVERMTSAVLIVTHHGPIKVLYSYFANLLQSQVIMLFLF